MSIIQYGLTMDNQAAIIKKGETKKDGIYKFRGVNYRVVDGHARFFASDGQVMEMSYGFNIIIGSYEHCSWSKNGKKALKSIKI